MTKSEQLRTVKRFAEERKDTGAFSPAALRWQIFNAESNGLAQSGAIVRVGRRVLIDPPRYDAWLNAQRETAARKAAA
jgi:hypothetical protein